MSITLKRKQSKDGWDGWCGGEIYTPPDIYTQEEIDHALQQKAKEIQTGAAILTTDSCLYGWGYTDARYKDGPYFYPFFIESDKFRRANKTHLETRIQVKEIV
jgi:hypothetical protein